MTSRRALLIAGPLALLLAAASGISPPARAGEPKVRLAIVVAKDSRLTELSSTELKALYLGTPVTRDGKPLIPLNLAASARERIAFERDVLGMSPNDSARYWLDRKIRKQSGPPKTIDRSDDMQRVLGKLPGAVGYALSTELRPEVKVVRIDGKGPSDPGYPFEL